MNKILLVTIDFPPEQGGIARYLSGLCNSFSKDRIVVCAQSYKNNWNLDKKFKYKVYRRNLVDNFPFFPKWLMSFWYIYKIIKKEKINKVLVAQVLPLGTVVWILSKILNIEYVVITHGMDILTPQNYKIKNWLLKNILKDSFLLTANSKYTQKELIKLGVNKKNILVIYPALDLVDNFVEFEKEQMDIFKLQENLCNKKILFSLGRLVKRKGFDACLYSLPKVIEKFPDVVYVIAGEGEAKWYLKNIVKKLNLEKWVRFLGKIDDRTKYKWLKVCDLFAMPARQIGNNDVEGFGIVYLEANFFKKPVLAGNSGGINEAVIDNYTGVLCDPYDDNDISNKIIELLFDDKKRLRLGQNGYERVLEEFSWDNQAFYLVNQLDK